MSLAPAIAPASHHAPLPIVDAFRLQIVLQELHDRTAVLPLLDQARTNYLSARELETGNQVEQLVLQQRNLADQYASIRLHLHSRGSAMSREQRIELTGTAEQLATARQQVAAQLSDALSVGTSVVTSTLTMNPH